MIYLTERITLDPDLCNGRPTIRGMRITVETVLNYLAAGDTVEDILQNFPVLEKEDIEACLSYASLIVGQKLTIKQFAA